MTLLIATAAFLLASVNPNAGDRDQQWKHRADEPGFVENAGQWDAAALYHGSFKDISVWVTETSLVFKHKHSTGHGDVTSMEFVGGRTAEVVGFDRMSTSTTFLKGDDPSGWISDVSSYQRLVLRSVYDGIDLVLRSEEGRLRYDFVVAPWADPDQIRLRFRGAEPRVEANDVLVLDGGQSVIRHEGLEAFQDRRGGKAEVAAAFIQSNQEISFAIGEYDPEVALVIDPLVFSTYLGGSGDDTALAAYVADDGTFWVAGRTGSADFPSGITFGLLANFDAFAAQYSSSGSLLQTIVIGGSENDAGTVVFGNSAGEIVVAGWTASTDFPVRSAYQSLYGGGDPDLNQADCFVTKITGVTIAYSTYLGGADDDRCMALEVADNGTAYVAGWTASTDFPASDNAYQSSYGGGERDAVFAAIGPSGTVLVASYLGGDGQDYVRRRMDLEADGTIWITGQSGTVNFPQDGTGVLDHGNVFVASIDSDFSLGQAFQFGGTDGGDLGWGIEVLDDGTALLAGESESSDFPTTDGSSLKGGRDLFVRRVNLNTQAALFSTLFGGGSLDAAFDVREGPNGEAVIAGWTSSSNYPTTDDAVDRTLNGRDAVISVFNGSGLLQHSTLYGGDDFEIAWAFDMVRDGTIFFAGETRSSNLPLESPDDGDYGGGVNDGFVTLYDAGIEVEENQAPQWTTIPDTNVGEGEDVDIDLADYASDPEGDNLMYGATSNNTAAATVAVSGSILTVTGLEAGSALITVEASDDANTSQTSFTVTVETVTVNAPDLIAPTSGTTDVSNTTSFQWSQIPGVSGYQVQVRYSGQSDLLLDASTGSTELTWIAPSAETQYEWRVRASDAGAAWSNWTAFETGSTGTLAPLPQSPFSGAIGVDLEPTLSWSAAPSAIQYEYELSLSGTVQETDRISDNSVQVGPLSEDTQYQWRVRGLDENDQFTWSASRTFTTLVETNVAPTVTEIPDQTILLDNAVVIDLSQYFADPNGDALNYEVVGGATILTVELSGDQLTLTGSQEGSANLTVTGTDPDNLSASTTFGVSVVVGNAAPFVAAPISDLELTVDGTQSINLDQVFSDPNGDQLTYSVSDPGSIATASVSGSQLNITADAAGQVEVTVTATDPASLSVSDSFTLTVSEETVAPGIVQLVAPSNGAVALDRRPTLSWQGATNADAYEIEVSTNSNFSSIQDAGTSTQTSYQVSSQLDPDTQHFWRVRGTNSSGPGDWSNAFSFTTYTAQVSINVNRTFGNVEQESSYRLIGLPGNVNVSVASTLTGSPGEANNWRAFRELSSGLQEYTTSNSFSFAPGRGYWVLSRDNLTHQADVSTVTLSDGAYRITGLNTSGWSIISNPLDVNVSWSDVEAANGGSLPQLWRWSGTSGWQTSTTFNSAASGYEAYYMEGQSGLSQILVPYPGAESAAQAKVAADRPRLIRLDLHAGGDVVSSLWAGVHPDANEGADRFDATLPPSYWQEATMHFGSTSENEESATRLGVSVAPETEDGSSFGLIVEQKVAHPLRIAAGDVAAIEDKQIYLVDPVTAEFVDLGAGGSVLVEPAAKARYILLIGTEAYIDAQRGEILPDRLMRVQAYPNPFEQSVRLGFAVPESDGEGSGVILTIHDALGRVVRRFERRDVRPGFVSIDWDGRTSTGAYVAAGLYFYQLSYGGERLTGTIIRTR